MLQYALLTLGGGHHRFVILFRTFSHLTVLVYDVLSNRMQTMATSGVGYFRLFYRFFPFPGTVWSPGYGLGGDGLG